MRTAYHAINLYFASSVSGKYILYPLLLNTFTTGLLDATSFGAYGIFSSNQTGNAIILLSRAIGVEQPYMYSGGPSLLTTGMSLTAFLVAAFISGRVGIVLGHRKRWWLLLSTAFQALFLLIPAVLIERRIIPPGSAGLNTLHYDATFDASPVSLLALSSGLQVAQARCSGVNEVPTAMLTSPMVDLLVHPDLFSSIIHSKDKNVISRNIRLAYLTLFLVGITVGATVHRFSGTAIVTFVAFALRLSTLAILGLLPCSRDVE